MVAESGAFEPELVIPLGFGLDPNHFYVAALHEGRRAIFRIDTATPDFARELVLSDRITTSTAGWSTPARQAM